MPQSLNFEKKGKTKEKKVKRKRKETLNWASVPKSAHQRFSFPRNPGPFPRGRALTAVTHLSVNRASALLTGRHLRVGPTGRIYLLHWNAVGAVVESAW